MDLTTNLYMHSGQSQFLALNESINIDDNHFSVVLSIRAIELLSKNKTPVLGSSYLFQV